MIAKEIWDSLQNCIFECGCCRDNEKALEIIKKVQRDALEAGAQICDHLHNSNLGNCTLQKICADQIRSLMGEDQ